MCSQWCLVRLVTLTRAAWGKGRFPEAKKGKPGSTYTLEQDHLFTATWSWEAEIGVGIAGTEFLSPVLPSLGHRI